MKTKKGEYTMMKLKNSFWLFALVLASALSLFAQTNITQTTLASAMTVGPAGAASGITGSYQTTVNLTSSTGVTAAVNGAVVTVGFVDVEALGFLSNPTGNIWTVLRGQFGTRASPHANGATILIQNVQPTAGFSGSGGLQVTDPPIDGNCTSTNTLVTPWINMVGGGVAGGSGSPAGSQWICSSVTNNWVPGWNNPLAMSAPRVTAAVASAAGQITPSGPFFHITGALAITGFLTPVGFTGKGQFCVVPDGLFTTTTANNIALASTAVVNRTLCWTFDSNAAKWTPTY